MIIKNNIINKNIATITQVVLTTTTFMRRLSFCQICYIINGNKRVKFIQHIQTEGVVFPILSIQNEETIPTQVPSSSSRSMENRK